MSCYQVCDWQPGHMQGDDLQRSHLVQTAPRQDEAGPEKMGSAEGGGDITSFSFHKNLIKIKSLGCEKEPDTRRSH